VVGISVLTSILTYLLVEYGGSCQPVWNTYYGNYSQALQVEVGLYGPGVFEWADDKSFSLKAAGGGCGEHHFNDMAYRSSITLTLTLTLIGVASITSMIWLIFGTPTRRKHSGR